VSSQEIRKVTHQEYLQSKVVDAATMCRDQITATAKDPTSLQFADRYSYGFGKAFTKNWIFIYWDIMGRNTYGAVLKHQITCTVSCKEEKACSWVEMKDE
jgi:hypothetical protein